MRKNHNYKKGFQNLFAMMDSLRKDHVKINSVTIIPETQEQQETGVVDVELEQNEEDDELSEDTDNEAGLLHIGQQNPDWESMFFIRSGTCTNRDSYVFYGHNI